MAKKIVMAFIAFLVMGGAVTIAGFNWKNSSQNAEPKALEFIRGEEDGVYSYSPNFFSPGIVGASKPLAKKIDTQKDEISPGFFCTYEGKFFYYSRKNKATKAVDAKECAGVFGENPYFYGQANSEYRACVNQMNDFPMLSFEVESAKYEDKEEGSKSGQIGLRFFDSVRERKFEFSFSKCSCTSAEDCSICESQHVKTVDISSGIPGRFFYRSTGGTDTQTQAEHFLSWGPEKQEITTYPQGFEPLQFIPSIGLFLDQMAPNYCCNSIGSTGLSLSGSVIREYGSAILDGRPIAFFFGDPKMSISNNKVSVNVTIQFDGMEGDPSYPKEKEVVVKQLVRDAPFVEILKLDSYGEVTSVKRLAHAHALDWQDENSLVVIRGRDLSIWNITNNSFQILEKDFIQSEKKLKSGKEG